MPRRVPRTTDQERERAGEFLKRRRIEVGATQVDVAKALGLTYPTYVSQIENGAGRVPTARYVEYTRVLKRDPQDFVKELLRYYDFEAWKILFGMPPRDGTQ